MNDNEQYKYYGFQDMERAMRDVEEMRMKVVRQLQTVYCVTTVDREPLDSCNILGVSTELIERAKTDVDHQLIIEVNTLMNDLLHSGGMLNIIPADDHIKLYSLYRETTAFLKGVKFATHHKS